MLISVSEASRAIFLTCRGIDSESPPGNILAVGGTFRSGGAAGAAYLYQLEANGTATYLTKVTAPDGAAGDEFGNLYRSLAIFLLLVPMLPIRGAHYKPGLLIFINWKPMERSPT